MTTTFYHFTERERLPIIIKDGLRKGDVPLSVTGGFNAVWLTTNPNPNKLVIGLDMAAARKREVRIKVQLSLDDPNLKKWSDVALLYDMDQIWYQILHGIGGQSSEHWWVYRGKITEPSIVSYSLLENINNDDGSYSYSEYMDTDHNRLMEKFEKKSLGQFPALSLFASPIMAYPEPETGWPAPKRDPCKCANYPNCTQDPRVMAKKRCKRCMKVYYHDGKCQREHWKEHKFVCKPWPET